MSARRRIAIAAAAVVAAAAGGAASSPRATPVSRDLLSDPTAWIAAPAEGVRMSLSRDSGERGPALKLDFDFQGHGGWATARRALPGRLPANWTLALRLRGETPPETLEVKLLDRSGDNVWWSVRKDFVFPETWTTVRFRRRQFSFAWGPAPNTEIPEIGAIEVTVTAGNGGGGKGTVWIAALDLEERPAPRDTAAPLRARASSSSPGHDAGQGLDGNLSTEWRSAEGAAEPQVFVVDLGGWRELGGIVVDWDARDYPRRYEVALSNDGREWSVPRTVSPSGGGRAWISFPDAEAAFVRVEMRESAGRGFALRELAIEPTAFSETPTAFLEHVAKDAPRREWPRSFRGEQLFWAVVGVDGGRDKGLLSEDGALEAGRGAFSVEPFLKVGDGLLGWSDAETAQELADGDLPIPTVRRRHANGLELAITALADGPSEASVLSARYRVSNGSAARVRATLYLAVRPLQVNPPWQFLATPGGFSPIRTVSFADGVVAVDGTPRLSAAPAPDGFGASRFDTGEIVGRLARGAFPGAGSASDPEGFASAALAWTLDLPPGASREVVVALPLSHAAGAPASRVPPEGNFEARLAAGTRAWREKLDRVAISLPPGAGGLERAVRASLAWILVDRDGPALQPGTRSYARSWIRDGALIGAALLRLGHSLEVRDFLRWYAPFQFDSGAVPCCVDSRGADPVPENDSHGELLYLAAEYFRMTGDRAAIEELWPRLAKAAAYIDALRARRRTDDYRSGEKRVFFGLLPESISHEGYSAHPVHSYWDDFWAVRGLADAADLGSALGRTDEARRIAASRDEMRRDVESSVRAVMSARRLDYVPGSADLGDFDATSTTIALDPCGAALSLPRTELERTFERFWRKFQERRRGVGDGTYTPYEWRIAGTYVRLGQPDRAWALFDAFLADRRPVAWNQWPEVVFRDARAPKFLGDLPHAWVSADFLRAFLDAIAWEREADGALVVLAGLRPEWSRGPGLSVKGLRTREGALDVTARDDGGVTRIGLAGTAVPRGGLVLRLPGLGPAARATRDGRDLPIVGGEILVRGLPAEILVRR